MGSIAGRLTLDVAARNVKCETKQPPAVEETLISFRTGEPDDSDPSSRYASGLLAPDSKGDFILQGLPAARHKFDIRQFLDEVWYVRAVTAPGPANTPVDASSNGVSLRPGQRINGLRVVLAEGAASIRGRVVRGKDGASLPERLRVHLKPAETKSAGDTLRYFETEIQSDGSFKLANIAPGRYWLLARPVSEEEAKERILRPLAWNTTSRASLRRDAETSHIAIELRPCQAIVEYELRYAALARQSPDSKRPGPMTTLVSFMLNCIQLAG